MLAEFAACILSTGHNIQKLYRESAEQQGVLGYIARSAIDAILSGEQADLSDAVFVYCPTGYLELLRLQDRFVYPARRNIEG